MQFLILGASGFLGSELRRLLDRERIPWLGTAQRAVEAPLVAFDLAADRLLDVLPAGYLESAENTSVIHATSFGSIDACFRHSQASRAVHIAGPQRIVEELRPYGVRHVFLSTNQVFDGQAPPYREEDPPSPLHEYGRQKLTMERFLLNGAPGSLVFRLDKLVSSRPGDGQLFDQWRISIAAGHPICCLPEQRLAPTLVSDVALAILTACRRGLAGLYHVANPVAHERRRLAEMFLEVMGTPGEIKMVSEAELNLAEPRPRAAVLDSSKFLATTGMTFTTPRAMLEQFRDA